MLLVLFFLNQHFFVTLIVTYTQLFDNVWFKIEWPYSAHDGTADL